MAVLGYGMAWAGLRMHCQLPLGRLDPLGQLEAPGLLLLFPGQLALRGSDQLDPLGPRALHQRLLAQLAQREPLSLAQLARQAQRQM